MFSDRKKYAYAFAIRVLILGCAFRNDDRRFALLVRTQANMAQEFAKQLQKSFDEAVVPGAMMPVREGVHPYTARPCFTVEHENGPLYFGSKDEAERVRTSLAPTNRDRTSLTTVQYVCRKENTVRIPHTPDAPYKAEVRPKNVGPQPIQVLCPCSCAAHVWPITAEMRKKKVLFRVRVGDKDEYFASLKEAQARYPTDCYDELREVRAAIVERRLEGASNEARKKIEQLSKPVKSESGFPM